MRISTLQIRRRFFIIMLIGFLLFFAIIARLGYLQLVIGGWLTEKAENSWEKNIPFDAKRGRLLDRTGQVLAYNVSSSTVMAIPAQIKDPNQTAIALAPILGMDQQRVYQLVTKRELMVKLAPGGRKISDEKAQQIRSLNLPGIVVTEETKRYYPEENFAANVLGFTGIDNQGLTGLELYYNDRLKGIPGSISFYSDGRGREMPNTEDRYTPPKDGLDLQLTLDSHIQSFVERELDIAMARYRADQALAIAMDPNTGEVLAMASRPSFDPNHYQDYPSSVYNKVLPIWMAYEPGSTFKIITLAAALEEHTVNLNDSFYDPGYIEVAGAHIHCWKRGGHGSETFLEVVENSCNPGFVAMGQTLGKTKLFGYIDSFGFGHKTGIDLFGEENGLIFNLKRVGPVELATTSFGQGVSVTPIQQVAAVSAAINGGKLFQPHLAKAWMNQETGEVIEQIQPKLVRQVISPETSAQVRSALESVVAKGTGANAFIDGYRVGGKTGTAQKVGPDGRYLVNNHIVSFIGFAPADDPKIVVYTAVDNPKGIQFGGVVAAPIVRNILEDSLHYLGVPPRKEQISKELKPGEQAWVEVPNLTGMKLDEIPMNFFRLKLEFSGEGNQIINQYPKPGTRVEPNTTIRVYLGSVTPPNK